MRFCRIVESEKTLKIISEHGKYAKMLGIAEDARGMVARLDLGKTRIKTEHGRRILSVANASRHAQGGAFRAAPQPRHG